MPVLSQCHSIIIDQDIILPQHGKELGDGIDDIGKRYIYQLMSNVYFPGSRTFDPRILLHSCAPKNNVRLDKQPQKICLRSILNMESIIR